VASPWLPQNKLQRLLQGQSSTEPTDDCCNYAVNTGWPSSAGCRAAHNATAATHAATFFTWGPHGHCVAQHGGTTALPEQVLRRPPVSFSALPHRCMQQAPHRLHTHTFRAIQKHVHHNAALTTCPLNSQCHFVKQELVLVRHSQQCDTSVQGTTSAAAPGPFSSSTQSLHPSWWLCSYTA
jgi:hypothetical protein